ncbi:hypothetical protein TIFTF001_022246 [Ficus carica]|uniref:Uncharacterized protein n=1 Tax=Ficus carica TaxID=3494 RepID=A0AA88AVM0_FICCA|nr:hypothetical protein TIFTF001_022246 [Ficus carica]
MNERIRSTESIDNEFEVVRQWTTSAIEVDILITERNGMGVSRMSPIRGRRWEKD